MLKEMFALLAGSIPIFAYLSPTGFWMACVGGVLLAILLWWLCAFLVGLWNTSFRFGPVDHLLCGAAAVWTVFFVVAFASAHEVGQTVDQEIASWTARMHVLFRLTHTPPTQNQAEAEATSTPLATRDDLLTSFMDGHPFLGKVLRSDGTPPVANERVTSSGIIDQVATAIANAARRHLDAVETRLQAALLLSFLLAQAVPFGLTGYLAYRDIQPSL